MVGRSGWQITLCVASKKGQLFDTMYHISKISDILRQGVGSLAQWLEYWISTPAVVVRIP